MDSHGKSMSSARGTCSSLTVSTPAELVGLLPGPAGAEALIGLAAQRGGEAGVEVLALGVAGLQRCEPREQLKVGVRDGLRKGRADYGQILDQLGGSRASGRFRAFNGRVAGACRGADLSACSGSGWQGDGPPTVAAVGVQQLVDPVQGVRLAGEPPGLGGAFAVTGLGLHPPWPGLDLGLVVEPHPALRYAAPPAVPPQPHRIPHTGQRYEHLFEQSRTKAG